MSDLSERMRNAIDVAEMGVTATPYISTEDIDDGMDAIKALYAYAVEVAELEAALRDAVAGWGEMYCTECGDMVPYNEKTEACGYCAQSFGTWAVCAATLGTSPKGGDDE